MAASPHRPVLTFYHAAALLSAVAETFVAIDVNWGKKKNFQRKIKKKISQRRNHSAAGELVASKLGQRTISWTSRLPFLS